MHKPSKHSLAGRRRLCGAAALAAALVLAGVGAARGLELDFEGIAPLSDAARVDFGAVQVSTALVLDEQSVELLTGLLALGTWATSGSQGLLNTLAPQIVFDFHVLVTDFAVDVLGLPGDGGVPQQVRLRALREGQLVTELLSDTTRIGDSGLHEDAFSLGGRVVDRVVLEPVLQDGTSGTTTFWLDTVRFVPVPEPASAALLLTGLCGLAAVTRRRV